ncbi:Ff.00g065940.m01.CDS01 [Fusarium sp. VM40]|nr:Ff.00g065940.m01.CDS01 [Fusarium sp. VM40]
MPLHLMELFLIVAVLILSVVRMLKQPKNAPRGRSTTMALGMSAKSLIILLYQLLSEHVQAFKKWSSLKAYVILNALEIVFWGAVAFMMIQANLKFCEGFTCILSWIVCVLGIIMSTIASYLTVITWLDFRHFRANGTHRGRHSEAKHVKIQSTGNSTDNIAMDEELLHEQRYTHTNNYQPYQSGAYQPGAYQSGDTYDSRSPSPWRQRE